MRLIKLSATPSTNTYLKRLVLNGGLGDFTVVVCSNQTQGQGQKGNSWTSESGKNLIVSILKKFNGFGANQGFGLNCLASLAIYDVLNELSVPDVKVKWPNDIMSGNKKLCGILIENTLKGPFIKWSVIGFGLNVNQTSFKGLPNATSLKLESGVDYDLEQLLGQILNRFKYYLDSMLMANFNVIKQKYEQAMFRKDLNAQFSLVDSKPFMGSIRGVTKAGLLIIERDNGKLVHYNFKEVKYIL